MRDSGRSLRAATALLLGGLTAALATGACAASSAEVRQARSVAYQVPFAVVWNAVVQETQAKYPRLAEEDPVAGRLLTDWHVIQTEATQEGGTAIGPSGSVNETPTVGPGGLNMSNLSSGVFIRIEAKVSGGPPWRVTLRAESAEYRPGMAMLQPITNQADEPPTVPRRVDALHVAIYRRLRPYAVEVKEAPSADTSAPAVDTSPWSNLSAGAALLVATAHAAAVRGDVDALLPLLDEGFTFSLGSVGSAAGAAAYWRADPRVLARLAETLAAGCGEGGGVVACPSGSSLDRGIGWRAGFRRVGDAWRFASFVSGD